jgi:uncharacterized protein with beta-barrel porin domain
MNDYCRKIRKKVFTISLFAISFLLFSLSNLTPAYAIITRDDVDPNSVVDTGNDWPAVGAIKTTSPFINFGTGVLINPRTILTAAHLFNGVFIADVGSEDYLAGGYEINVSMEPQFSAPFISATDLVLHPDNTLNTVGNNWVVADIALVSLSQPIGSISSMPLLFSGVEVGMDAKLIGYGLYGSGSAGATGIDFRRRVGENVLGFIGTLGQVGFAGFPGQELLFTDFDDPLNGAANVFTGDDALPNEAAPAGGDSGGPLVLTFGNQRLVCGVLSGGDQPVLYDTVSFWQPLYLYSDFLAEHNPYKYVNAKAGDGSWTDPDHWIQILDPGYFIVNGSGQVVNGLPGAAGGSTSGPEGPGSTGFVPNNTDGVVGVAYANPAQYFDVILAEEGMTTLSNATIEIDRLTMAGNGSGLTISNTGQLTSLLNTAIQAGSMEVNGIFKTSALYNLAGLLRGNGAIETADAVYNIAGVLSPGSSVGTMTLQGDFINTSGGTFLTEFDSSGNDLLVVNGDAGLDGALLVWALGGYVPTEGDSFQVLTANSITGDFASVGDNLTGVLYARVETSGNSVMVFIDAGSYTDLAQTGNQRAVGAALDSARKNAFATFQGLFSEIDQIPKQGLPFIFDQLMPYPAFFQGPLNSDFSMAFAERFSARGLELREGGPRVSIDHNLFPPTMLASNDPTIPAFDTSHQGAGTGKELLLPKDFGMFLSGDFTFGEMRVDVGNEDFGAGGFTVGFDYRVSENIFVGVSGSYSKGEVDFGSFEPLVSEGFALGVYSTARAGNWFADFYAAYGKQDYDQERMIATPVSSRLAESSTSADQIFAGIRGGYDFDYNGWHIDLSTALRYARLHIEGYSESGAGIYNLTVKDRHISSIQVEGEIEIRYDIERSGFVLTPFVFLVGGLELKDELDTLESLFTASPALTAFSVSTDLEEDWTALGLGLRARINEKALISLRYQTDIGQQITDSSRVSASLRLIF